MLDKKQKIGFCYDSVYTLYKTKQSKTLKLYTFKHRKYTDVSEIKIQLIDSYEFNRKESLK